MSAPTSSTTRRILAASALALAAWATPLAGEVTDADPRTIAALRAFEERIDRLHASQIARSEPSGTGGADVPAPPRLRLGGVLDRMSISASWQVEQESWSAGIRLRYSRAVEFDPSTDGYALIEAIELAPAATYRIVALGRASRTAVRRTGFGSWEAALFARPSRWLFGDRPNRPEEAEQLAPGTAITVSTEATFFLGATPSSHLGEFPWSARAGLTASGEYFVRLERLTESAGSRDGRDWIVSVGGLIPRGFETAAKLRSPEILGKHLRLVEARWRLRRGVRFLLRAGPLDLPGDPEAAEFLRSALSGASFFRFADVRLLAANLGGTARAKLGPDLLARMERLPQFERLVAVANADPEGIPHAASVSRFVPRAHGEAAAGFWLLLYGLDVTSHWYAEESLLTPPGQPASRILSYPLQNRRDRGWVLFPRETQDLQMVTVRDGEGDDLFTELSLEIEDARAHPREGRRYRAQVSSVLAGPIEEAFLLRAEAGAPVQDERVSIYLRIILGPRFHAGLLADSKDERERRDRITAWQKRLSATVRRSGDAIDALVRAHGTEDLFVSYRIALTPYSRRKETPRPTTLLSDSFGDPQRIPSYGRLREAFDAAGTVF